MVSYYQSALAGRFFKIAATLTEFKRGRSVVPFCFTVNWMGPDSSVPDVLAQGAKAVAGMLAAVANWITREAPTP